MIRNIMRKHGEHAVHAPPCISTAGKKHHPPTQWALFLALYG